MLSVFLLIQKKVLLIEVQFIHNKIHVKLIIHLPLMIDINDFLFCSIFFSSFLIGSYIYTVHQAVSTNKMQKKQTGEAYVIKNETKPK